MQASAQVSCNGLSEANVVTLPPFFLVDPVELELGVGAGTIQGGSTIAIPEFSYFTDCSSGQTWFNCTDQPNDVEFLNIVSTDCVNAAAQPIVWDPQEAAEVTFVATNGPAVVPANSTCSVNIRVRVNTISPATYPKTIYGAVGFDGTSCDNGQPGSATGSVAFNLQSCAIDLTKEVSNDGGTSWFDANVSPGPDIELPGDALYRLIVSNTGTANFVAPITINDGALGINDAEVPALNAGAWAIVGSGDIPALFAEDRCTQAGALNNTSNADAVCRADTLVTASDNDNAWVNCVPPPSIDIKKYVSVDGGTTFFDANEVDKSDWPPAVEFPHGALYKIVVSNDGAVDLVNVVVNDSELGITDYSVGNLAAGAWVTLEEGDIPALNVAERCDEAGVYTNTATADGDSAISGTPADQASDPANMECVPPPSIRIEKYIRLPGTVTWLDADTVGTAPTTTFPSGAEYQIEVCNNGDVDLVNVYVNDADLGIVDYLVGNLAAGDCETLDGGDIAALTVAERCDAEGEFLNTAYAEGESAITGSTAGPVNDPAWLVCTPEGMEICRTIGFWGARGGDEKAPKSQNVTLQVLCGEDEVCDEDEGLTVCGVDITDTDLNSPNSAIEAICQSPKGDQQIQLMRQLTGAFLNCNLGECSQSTLDMIEACDQACIDNEGDLAACIGEVDCFNNGGTWDEVMGCTYPGTCTADGEFCLADEDCAPVLGEDNYCVTDENCHDRDACPDWYDNGELDGSDFCFEPLGPASSPKKCQQARKNELTLP